MKTKIIKLDINKKLYETISAKQGDTESRFLLFHIFNSSLPFDLTGKSVRIYGIKPDDKKIFNDLVINDAKKGYCTLELTNQMLAIAGLVKLELVIYNGNKKLSSIPFVLDVISSLNSDDAVVSTNEFTVLMNALKTVGDIDNKAEKKEVEKLSEQLDNIEKEIIKPKLKLGKVYIPKDLKELPFNIYKNGEFAYNTDFNLANVFDFKNCTEIFIGNNTNGTNNGLYANSPISLKTFINNFKSGT